MNANVTDKIIAFLNSTGSATVKTYMRYQIVSAEMWLAFSALCLIAVIVCSVGAFYYLKKDESGRAFSFAFTGTLLVIVAGAMIAANLPTMLAPRAAAIHQLLTDIRGGNGGDND
jgi:glucose uptake protein GlcU